MIAKLYHHLHRFRHDRSGTALVEMALIAPLMLVLSAGVFEFGNLIHEKLLMEAGLSDGARFAARCNSQLYTNAGLTIDCANIATNIAVFGNAAGTGNARVNGWQKADVTVTIAASGSCHDAVVAGVTQYRSTTAQVCIVRAAGTLDYSDVGMLSLLSIGPITLNGFHEERLIRF
ncbi:MULTISPECIES: TadE/TadG family type IV pilus assembly protein [unclassified Mesorhizobium]|uniref:TadE/TadG family type IV pilus assembly protein n=1 Tax=unclassified Mesorhizobium TaxID=325217 RepID=UPI000FCCBD68|nr:MULTISPECIES: TadE/TadG family type IV pilus assembly protein [unclassified Mesorhizobium]RUU67867.1 pilus assembly protein [Mesorhizobium sp. M7A.T.Ca.TU.009.01.1.1]RUU85501.1 pilus assembly protein [Mesorhizobium sp. M7A.T.Ca.TU.009.01.1.2]RUT89428.1 pilus assembly protein [Mesorhizobium sp. M7A.T.Ca.US.000.02.1.1]RUT92034.1 pilus assembly protein [Mesorhizobium sp. M7A.T.Ca.US.000.02.2.1]RUU05083.1 pilus assembly protein [Mesorhizobium sp. M7A.T.Ca.TU.009.02.1.1]